MPLIASAIIMECVWIEEGVVSVWGITLQAGKDAVKGERLIGDGVGEG